MPWSVTPTTELEAVNECLQNIGQAPVSTISGDLGVDTQMALNMVRNINRELQSRGWYWNTEKDYELTPNGDNDILLPSNTLSVDTTYTNASDDFVQRGSRLYNRDDHTYVFTESVYVELIVGLTFEELPETARRFIAMRAARMFQDRIEGNEDQGDSVDEMSAMSVLHADQLRTEDSNMLSNSNSMTLTLNRRNY